MIERQTIVVRADGSVAIPDLTSELAVAAEALGGAAAERLSCSLGGPRIAVAKRIWLPVEQRLETMPEAVLWRWHARGAQAYREVRVQAGDGQAPIEVAGGPSPGFADLSRGERWSNGRRPQPTSPPGRGRRSRVRGQRARQAEPNVLPPASWLAIKQALAHRLLGPTCRLCARRCEVDRTANETGFCGLGPDLRLTTPIRLWGEEPELGRPGLGLMTGGCGLRCRFCYRPENLDAEAGEAMDPSTVAGWIDAAADVEHVHFLGGNPDESLPGILNALARVRVDRPVVWNTHSHLTAAQALLLEGVVDGFVADLKFGPSDCAATIAGIPGYWPTATATLRRLARFDSPLLVRHVVLPGHLECCAEPVARWLKTSLTGATVRLLDQYEPLHRAAADPVIGRRLSAVEQASLADLAKQPGGKDGKHG